MEDPPEYFEENDEKSRRKGDDFVSKPFKVEGGTIPLDILTLDYSYGYNCKKYFNLCVADPETIIYASGNLIHFFNVKSNKLTFRRGFTGKGIAHITKNPVENHLAVGENGPNAPIIIYEWPSMNVIDVLSVDSVNSHSYLTYNPSGELLASQSENPNYLFIWDWRKSIILLKYKSHHHNIHNIVFSLYDNGCLVSSGIEHIQFWKMAETFTGLKLEGKNGKFGKTEISDIIGIYIMPDGKVVSGCKWGNILIWEDNLIKLEVRRKNKESCHLNMITQFEYFNGELMSIGMDGWIKVWYFETIDQANPSEDRFIEVEPIYEFQVKNNDIESAMLMSMQKQSDQQSNWYAQDGNGGLWLIDLTSYNFDVKPKKLLTCHSSAIKDITTSTWGNYIATCDSTGHLHIYNYQQKHLLLSRQFQDSASKVIWFPCSIEATGCTIACAFQSGMIRLLVLETNDNQIETSRLVQVIKPHKSAINDMLIDHSNRLLITGSDDATIFTFVIDTSEKYPTLIPIGFIKLPSSVTCMTWMDTKCKLFVGCLEGDCVEIKVPDQPQSYTTISYELTKCQPKAFKFHSKLIKLKKKSLDEEEQTLAEEESKQSSVSNRILTVTLTKRKTIWLTVAGDDAKGFIYEYSPSKAEEEVGEKPFKNIAVVGAEDQEIHSCLIYKEKYLILGLDSGEIRVCKLKEKNYEDLSDYWSLPLHEPSNGIISKILLSYDQKMVFTCGYDFNLFSFVIKDEHSSPIQLETPSQTDSLPEMIEDIDDVNYPSLEEVITKKERDRIIAEAEKRKNETLKILEGLQKEYEELVNRNKKLLKSQQIPQEEFELDPRITEDLNNKLQNELDLVYKQMEFQVEKSRLGLKKLMDHFIKPLTHLPFSISKILKPNERVHSLPESILDTSFYDNFINIESAEEETLFTRQSESRVIFDNEAKDLDDEERLKFFDDSDFLEDLNLRGAKSKAQINQILRKYKEKRNRKEARNREWKEMYEKKPNPNADYPEEIEAIEEAKNTIGDYKLKTSDDYILCNRDRNSFSKKLAELLAIQKKVHQRRENFTKKLKALREEKLKLHKETLERIKQLQSIHKEIPEESVKPLPNVPEIDFDLEFPERNLELEKYQSKEELKTDEEEVVVPVDEEFEMLLRDRKELEESVNQFDLDLTLYQGVPTVKCKVDPDILHKLNSIDQVKSPWEKEMIAFRMNRKIYEQDCILNQVKASYECLDKHLDVMEHERLDIQSDTVYSQLYQLTLMQELMILRDFQAKENEFKTKINRNIKEIEQTERKIEKAIEISEEKSSDILKFQLQIKNLNSQLMDLINDNKYREFLKRIYKKKMKTTRLSVSEQSSSDYDDDEADNDSENLQSLDENVCPPKCDEQLYKSVFVMRNERYKLESSIEEYSKAIESLKIDIEKDSKKLKSIQVELADDEQEFLSYRREKQKKLNEVEVTAVLQLHQLQHFVDGKFVNLQDTVVFDRSQLTWLYNRVGELQEEITHLKLNHKKNQTHLHRMKIDFSHMEDELNSLKEKIREETLKKFGREISLNLVYKTVLKKMVYDNKSSEWRMTQRYEREIQNVKTKNDQLMNVLKTLIQENIKKINLLIVLEEEQAKLKKILKVSPESEEDIKRKLKEFEDDIEKLEIILKNQRLQKEFFQNEINNLRSKSRVMPNVLIQEHFKKRQAMNEAKAVKNIEEFTETLVDEDKSKEIDKEEQTDDDVIEMVQLLIQEDEGENKWQKVESVFQEIMANDSSGEKITNIYEKLIDSIEIQMDKEQQTTVTDNLNAIISRLNSETRGIEAGSVIIRNLNK